MTFWKITTENKPEKVATTKLQNEHILEKNLEDWVERNTELLGEPLLIIGRQIIIPEVKDRLDLLALDPQGRAVIIELKRGKMSSPIDMQALRYASYISKWKFEDFEAQAKAYMKGDKDFIFNEVFENFCSQSGVDEIPDLNNDQRIIIAGSEVRDKLGSVALWLYEHSINIKVIEIDSYKEGDSLLLQPRTIIPLAVNKFSDVGKASKPRSAGAYSGSGRSWHLDKRMKAKTKEMFLQLDTVIRENFNVEGPNFDQKRYITYTYKSYNWISVITHANSLVLLIPIKPGTLSKSQIAKDLGIQEFDSEDSFSEKINLPSSINIRHLNENVDRIILRVKDGFDLHKPFFLAFLKNVFNNFPK